MEGRRGAYRIWVGRRQERRPLEKPRRRKKGNNNFFFNVVPCMLFKFLLYCSNSKTSLHFKTLKSHIKTLKIRPYMFRSSLKPYPGGPWPYFARLVNWNVGLHLL
jgi:hypothetical protein